ncbi:MAG: zinc dependent phospholipase C family protein [Candidatus Binataceae bacterium]|nr:zinc dependent phospholipase C family protein [Candidatus Binataceae bacterium]
MSALLLIGPASGQAFSVLAHQAVVDQAWDNTLLPLVRKRFPTATEQELADARAYAHGGSHLPDLGYFPLGSRLFTDLLHYVRTGDFYGRLLAEAGSAQEYAFALGMLAHYEVDSIGHPEATNVAVPIIYPKLAKRYGDSVTYADSPSAHIETEFRFDVLQVAHRREIPNLFEHSIEFKVPRTFLQRAFRETYGLELNDLFANYDVALNTYRWGFRTLLNEGTGIAWQLYRQDINSLEPGITSGQFVHSMTRIDFVQQFGKAFLEPGYFVRFIAFIGNLIPDIGPFRELPYKPLDKNVQQLYFSVFHHAYEEYVQETAVVAEGKTGLANLTLDTGKLSRAGEYAPADRAYVELLHRHAQAHFSQMPKALADDMRDHFRDRSAALAFEHSERKREKASIEVSELEAAAQSGAH